MGEQGVVIAVSGDELTVSLLRKEACAKCRACIAGLTEKEMILKAKNGCNAREHDRVNVEMETGLAFNAVMILYGVPLVFFIAGVALGYFSAQLLGYPQFQEAAAIVLGVVGILLAYLFIRFRDKRADRSAYTPVATAVVSEP